MPASLSRAWLAAPPIVRGAVMVLLSTLTGAVSNALIHHVAAHIHAFEVAFFRCLFGLIVLSPVIMRNGFGVMKTDKLKLHLARGFLQSGSMLLGFLGLALAPLAKATSLQFTAPLFAAALAVVVLGEVIRIRRLAALAVGFSGALVVLQPWTGTYDVGAWVSLGSAAIFAVVMIITRTIGKSESSVTQILWMTLLTTPATLIAAVFVWTTPDLVELAFLAGVGLFATLNHVTMAQALREAELTAVTPVQYTKLIWAALIGFFVFGEIPDLGTWIGGTLIFASVTYIVFREQHLKKQAKAAGAPAKAAA